MTAAARNDNVLYVHFPTPPAPASGPQRLVAGEGGTDVEAAPGKTTPATRPTPSRFARSQLRRDLADWFRLVGFLTALLLTATVVDHIRGALQ